MNIRTEIFKGSQNIYLDAKWGHKVKNTGLITQLRYSFSQELNRGA